MMNEQWFKLSIQQIEKKLKTNAALGLTRRAARSRVNKHSGSVFVRPKASSLRIVGELVSDFSWILLVFAAVISLFFEEYRTGLVVFFVLCANLLVSFLTYRHSLRSMERLSTFFYPKARMIRGGRFYYGDADSLVPGDVILIEQGDILCCDARLVSSDALSVRMRLDQKSYVDLNKFAEGFLSPQIRHPKDMVNMVHAGSVVTQGSARAIVTAVGSYTYLGAMTGGVPFPYSNKPPKAIVNLRQKCAKWNTILLLSVLPLCMISLFFGHFFGGTIFLSTAFLTYMSVVATGISHMICTIGTFFYTKQAVRLHRSKHPSVVRSLESLDRLSEIDYLFVRDAAAFTDGIMHFDSAVCPTAPLKADTAIPSAAKLFCDTVALYYTASTEAPTIGFHHASKFQSGISEFLRAYAVDREALRIRCKILSYLPGNLTTEDEKLCFEDRGCKRWISVSSSLHSLYTCASVYTANGARSWNNGERDGLIAHCRKIMTEGHCIPLIFRILSEQGTNQENALLGIAFLKEGIDAERLRHMDTLAKLGCRVILFSDSSQAPELPILATEERIASKQAFLSRGLPLTYQFGRFRQYTGFQAEDIQLLADHVHAQEKKVGLLFFNEQPTELLNKVDLTISCSAINASPKQGPDAFDYIEVPGNPNSTTCTQAVTEQASILIPRPSSKRGGLASIIYAIQATRKAHVAFSEFLSYMLCAQVMRLIVSIVPMLAGRSLLDARHLIFSACIIDLWAFFLFAQKMKEVKAPRTSSNLTWVNQKDLICTSIASVLILISPYITEWIGIFGTYLYATEFTFTAMISLQLMLVCVSLYPTARDFRTIWRNTLLGGGLLAVILFIIFCHLSPSLGLLFSIEKNPLAYMIVSRLPSFLFVVIHSLQSIRKRTAE